MDDENKKEENPPQKKTITPERAFLKEYFNDNWISVLLKAGGTIISILVFGFWIGWWAKGISSPNNDKVVERHTVEIQRDTVYLKSNKIYKDSVKGGKYEN